MNETMLSVERKEKALAMLREPISAEKSKYDKYNNARRTPRQTRKLEQLMANNFSAGDLHVSCTYTLPQYDGTGREELWISREEAKNDARNFIAAIEELLKRHGCDLNEFRLIAVTVTKEGDVEAREPHPPVHHHQILMHGVPKELRRAVEKLWSKGWCNADYLRPDRRGKITVFRYIARCKGGRRWVSVQL